MVGEDDKGAVAQEVVKFCNCPFLAYASRSVMDQFCSVMLKVCEATAMTFFFPLSASCIKMAPHATSLASVLSVKSWEKSGNEMTGGEESRSLIF